MTLPKLGRVYIAYNEFKLESTAALQAPLLQSLMMSSEAESGRISQKKYTSAVNTKTGILNNSLNQFSFFFF